jgi:hypothetical protein
MEEFEAERPPEEDEIQIYTWRDATLRELSSLIKEVYPQARHQDVRFAFRLVYADLRGRFLGRDLGMIFNRRHGRDDDRTLESARFFIGDYVDVALFHGSNVRGGNTLSSGRSFERGPFRASRSGHDDRFYRRERSRDRGRREAPTYYNKRDR